MPNGRSRRDERKEETRRELIAAAAKVFVEDGFQAASVERIAREAGFTTGAVYRHFSRKDELFLVVFEEYVLGRVAEVNAAHDTADPRRMCHVTAPFDERSPSYVRTIVLMSSRMDAAIDGRRVRGDRTRRAILAEAVDLASVEGLEGLSIGRLARQLSVSKSGLFAHFGSKEELQLETIDAASAIFQAEVWEPVAQKAPGLEQLTGLLESWLAYFTRGVFAGGCFFANVQHEFDSRPGPVRDRIADHKRRWSDLLVAQVKAAQARGQLDPEVHPEQLAFELDSFPLLANSRFQLTGDTDAFALAADAITRTISAARPRESSTTADSVSGADERGGHEPSAAHRSR